jgi:hypothetical protein
MYIYIDKFDYAINNLNNEDIEEEIEQIGEKLEEIESNNIFYFKNLKEKINNGQLGGMSKLNLTLTEVSENRYENLTNQIFVLQMKQFAESICSIKKDMKKNKYVLLFDQSEFIEPLSLDENDYKELLKYRDPMNSISIYDLFQEKIHSYYNAGKLDSLTEGKNIKMKLDIGIKNKKRRGRLPKKINTNIINNISTAPKKRGRKRKIFTQPLKNMKNKKNNNIPNNKKNEDIEIAKVVSINYNFCHHCKQRKPAEVMVKCNSSNCGRIVEKPMKTFYVNNTTVVRKFKNFIITNFSGDPKDILDGYLNKSKILYNFRNHTTLSSIILSLLFERKL